MKEDTRIHRFGDWYHRRVYGRITGATARLTDCDFPLTDLAIPAALYSFEGMTAGMLGVAATLVDPNKTTEERVAIGASTALALAPAAALFFSTYGINYFRKPLDQKLGIETRPFDTEDELAYVIGKINERSGSEHLEFDDVTPLAYEAVDTFVRRVDGYSIPTTKRAKHSRFGRMMLWKMGAVGLLNPYAQEVVFMTKLYPEVIAHEFAHLKGIPQERYAQLVGIVAQIESGNPSLEYLGYNAWLELLLNTFDTTWVKEPVTPEIAREQIYQQLRDRGLNERTISERGERARTLQSLHGEVMSYSVVINALTNVVRGKLPKAIDKRIPEGVRRVLADPERELQYVMRNLILKLSRQTDVETAYTSAPLELLHAYRTKYYSHSS